MNRYHKLLGAALFCSLIISGTLALAETGHDAWLRYAPLDPSASHGYASLPNSIVAAEDSLVMRTARAELVRGIQGMLSKPLQSEKEVSSRNAFILGTVNEIHHAIPALKIPANLEEDGYWLKAASIHGRKYVIVSGRTDRGVLYGVFALLSQIAQGRDIANLDQVQDPGNRLRWVNQWDNLDGRIERGYAGASIFFENGNVRADLKRVSDYGRLLASVGINGCVINNVNADPRTLASDFIPQLARVADEFRPWGVKLALSANFASPKQIGKLDTFDPLDPSVVAWWRNKVDEIYRQIPDFGGFVMKADSEGQLGPSTYNRSPSEAANVIARALRPHGGVLFYRAFVYNHHLDWNNPKNDRARAAYDIFHPLDGQFDDNVIVQIKYGPIDFQVREPASPLFAGLKKTNEAIELQITQEYLGQQRHLCFLAPLWKGILDFDMKANGPGTPVKDLISGKTFHHSTGGFVGVANVGMDDTWLGNPLAMANLFAFGRLAWNPNLSSQQIIEEWTRLTFGNDLLVVKHVSDIQLASWPAYESYTGPLGLQTLTNILGPHYGPGIESSEGNGWGQWHRADREGVGMDRTVATGTGFAGQYPRPVAQMYESLATTPDQLILFFHHVPYSHVLHSGRTVIQEIYDLHYAGATKVDEFISQWKSLRGRIDDERFNSVLAHLEYQSGHAIVWRDAVCNYFLRLSGIPDGQGRVGNHPDRIEAESMNLKGYVPIDIKPWEDASGGKGIACCEKSGCSASFKFDRPAQHYKIDVQFFDQRNGESKFSLFLNDKKIDQWVANDQLPAITPNGDSSTRFRIHHVFLHPGDEIRIEGIPDGDEHAPVDYVEIHPDSSAN